MTSPTSPPDINRFISAIADEAETKAPAGYASLIVEADFSASGVADLHGFAEVGSQRIRFRVGFDTLDLFEEMRKVFESEGHPLWTRATVTVSAVGEAMARFTYPDTLASSVVTSC